MAPNKKKWDDKMERDFLMAIRVAESAYTPITRATWNKATELMKMMGYADSTWTGISQRWSKNIQKDFQADYPLALQIAAGQITASTTVGGPATISTTAATASSAASGSGSASAPVRRARAGRAVKREREEEQEDNEDGEEEVAAKKTSTAKKQKKN
ncbi:hypothetical protein F4679DRAFT_582003 [Xylaria curta]|nr:hypothetical protein F4679DRAFT_582003 [Xylaria curta]